MQEVEQWLREDAEADDGDGEDEQNTFGDDGDDNGVFIPWGIPIHGFNDFKVVIKSGGNADEGDGDEEPAYFCVDGGAEDEEFAPESGGEWDSGKRCHGDG